MFRKIILLHLLALLDGISSQCYEVVCLDDDANIEFNQRVLNYSLASCDLLHINMSLWYNDDCDGSMVHLHVPVDFDHLNKSECEIKTGGNNNYISTSLFYKSDPEHTKNCSKKRYSFYIQDVSNGCYQFEIIRENCMNASRRKIYKFLWIFIETESKINKIGKPQFRTESDAGTNLTLKWTFVNVSIIDNVPKYIIYMPNSGKCVNNRSYVVDVGFVIECKLMNWYSGNYSVKLEVLVDPRRCDTPDKNYCIWESIFQKRNATELKTKYNHDESASWFTEYSIGVGCIFLIVNLSLIYHCYRKRNIKECHQSFDRHICDSEECCSYDNNVNGILLLYPLDCEAFMETMKQLRIFLETSTDCEIYDLFDEARFNEIAESSESWVRKLINDPSIKILIPATKCGDILYQNLLNYSIYKRKTDIPATKVQYYREPNYLNPLFMYALDTISKDVTPTPYRKIFMLTFSHIDKFNRYLAHINPFKRFQLPKNLQILIDCVMGYYQPNNSVNISNRPDRLELCNLNISSLTNSLESLQTYINANPFYLENEILNVK